MNKALILWCFLAQIRKIRSLTELINEAEETFTNPINQVKMELSWLAVWRYLQMLQDVGC